MYAIQTKRGWVKEDPSAPLGYSVGDIHERWITQDESEAIRVRDKLNAGTVIPLGVPIFMRSFQ